MEAIFMKLVIVIFGIISLLLTSQQCVAAKRRDLIFEAYKNAEFTPYVYDDHEIVNVYGVGYEHREAELCRRVYKTKSTWVSAAGFCEQTGSGRIIQEIMISAYPIAKKSKEYNGRIDGIKLFNVGLGDEERLGFSAAKKHHGMEVRYTTFNGLKVKELSFFPSADDTNLYYTYVIKNKKILAIVIGITD
jgi:hypothetical protein